MSDQEIVLKLKTLMDVSDIKGNVGQIQQLFGKLKLSDTMSKDTQKIFNDLEKAVTSYQSKLENKNKKKSDVTGLQKEGQNIIKLFSQLESQIEKVSKNDLKNSFQINTAEFQKTKQDLEQVKEKIDNLNNAQKTLSTTFKDSSFKSTFDDIKNGTIQVDSSLLKAVKSATSLRNVYSRMESGDFVKARASLESFANKLANEVPAGAKGLDIVQQEIEELRTKLDNTDASKLTLEMEKLSTKLLDLETRYIDELDADIKSAASSVGNLKDDFSGLNDKIINTADAQAQFNKETDQLKTRIATFFGLNNAIQLVRRGLQQVYNTIKDLDAAMTETAVVTDFTISDLWQELPTYTKRANSFGLAIKNVYEADTLYYQQGLKTQEVVALSNETMKMARIASLDTAEATERMTNALRGFNMELDQTSAQKVADVYSELAAITAADVDQLSSAMTKTASIASNAGATFENTAAFIAQIVETTQESAETAGTALKTVIARFTELKKDPSEIGEVDGEIIDANKIETALRSVGIALRDTKGEFRNFDDVILELSAKWDTLSTNSQRYIATIAAGSRQQSRFIALMSNNARLTELVSAANSAAGASQEQYNKTMDSLATKINQLQNSWNTFLLNIANNDVIKGALDILINFLNGINKLTEVMPSAARAVANFLLAITAFVSGGAIFKAFSEASAAVKVVLGQAISEGSEQAALLAGKNSARVFGKAFKDSLSGSFGSLKKPFAQVANGSKEIINTFKTMSRIKVTPDFDSLIQKQKQALNAAENIFSGIMNENFDLNLKQHADALNAVTIARGKYVDLTRLSSQYNSANAHTQLLVNSAMKQGASDQALLNILTSQGSEESIRNAAVEILRAKGIDETSDEYEEKLRAQMASLAADKLENASKLQQILLLFSSNKAIRQEAMSKLGLASSTNGATGAQWGLNAATYAFPGTWILAIIVAIIAATALLVVGLIALSKAIVTDAEKIENLKEVIEELEKELEGSKSRLDEIISERDDLKTLTDEFNSLTQGTEAWRQKLTEINSQVLELINKYPQLQEYLKVGQNGAFVIEGEGWDQLIQQQQIAIRTLQSAKLGANLSISDLEQDIDAEEFRKSLDNISNKLGAAGGNFLSAVLTGGIGAMGLGVTGAATAGMADLGSAATGIGLTTGGNYLSELITGDTIVGHMQNLATVRTGVSHDEFSTVMANMAEAAAKSGKMVSDLTKEEMEEIFNSSEISGSFEGFYLDIRQAGTALDEFANSALAAEHAMEKQRDDYIHSLLASDSTIQSSQYSEAAYGFLDLSYDNIDTLLEETEKQITNNTDKLVEQYSEIMGLTEDEIRAKLKSEELSKETMQRALAQKKIDDQLLKDAKIVLGNMDKITDKTSATIVTNLMSNEGTGLTHKNLEDLQKYLGGSADTWSNEDIDKYLKSIGMNNGIADLGIAYDDFRANVKNAETTFNNVFNSVISDVARSDLTSLVDQLGGQGFDFSALQLQQLATAYNNISNQGGDTATYTQAFTQLMSQTNNLNRDQVLNLLSSMSTADNGNIETTINELRDLGLVIDEDLSEAIIDATNAIHDFDIESFTNKITNLNEIGNKLSQGERSFSQEEVDTLVGGGVSKSQFAKTSDGYRYLGNTADLLKQTSEIATSSLTDAMDNLKKLKERTDQAEQKWKEIINKEVEASQEEISNFQALIAMLKEWFTNIVNTLKQIINGLIEKLGELIASKWDELAEKYNKFIDGIESFFNTLIDVFNKLVDFLDNLGIHIEPLQEYKTNLQKAKTTEEIQKEQEEKQARSTMLQSLDSELQEAIEMKDAVEISADTMDAGAIYDNRLVIEQSIAENEQRKQRLLDEGDDGAAEKVEQIILAQKQIIDSFDTALVSKATNYEELLPQVQRYQKAVQDGNTELADQLRLDLLNALKSLDGTSTMERVFGDIEKDVELIESLGVQAQESNQYLEQMAYTMGFDDIDQGVNFIRENFELLKGAIEGDINSLQQLQKNLLLEFGLSGELDTTNIMNGLMQLGTNAQAVLNQLLDVGAFHLEKIVATSTTTVPNITLEEGTPTINGSTTVEAGAEYYVLKPNDSSMLTTATNNIGSKKEETKWENSYDRYYNLLQDINAEMRERNRLEHEFERMQKKSETFTASKGIKNLEARAASMNGAIVMNQKLRSGREDQLKELMQKNNSKYGDLIGYNQADGTLEINWNKINAKTGVWSEEQGQEFEEYVSQLEGYVDEMHELDETIEETKDELEELKETGREEYLQLEQKVYDAILKREEELIEGMQNVNDSINSANDELLNGLQKSIDKMRRERQNEETEKEIAEQEQQLAYLSQSTISDPLEIMRLEEQIADARQDYTDQLIDQKISDLQEQNEQAANQREKQISIAQAQLDYNKENGIYWNEVKTLLNDQNNFIDGQLKSGGQLDKLLKSDSGWAAMSDEQRKDWKDEIDKMSIMATIYQKNWDSSGIATEKTLSKYADANDARQKTLEDAVRELKNPSPETTPETPSDNPTTSTDNSAPKDLSAVYDFFHNIVNSKDLDETEIQSVLRGDTKNITSDQWKDSEGIIDKSGRFTLTEPVFDTKLTDQDIAEIIFSLRDERDTMNPRTSEQWNKYYRLGEVIAFLESAYVGAYDKYLPAYKTGGLADFTGPAWLDGTKSAPEIVLNAQDTRNFLQLRDILSDLFKGGNFERDRSSGDNYYDIDINVDEISNDYDVDQLAARIKQQIVSDSMYRNVNAINFMR